MGLTSSIITKHIKVYGIVQGVGFRPTVARHAQTCGVTGSVANRGPFVEIYAQGTQSQVQMFLDLISSKAPERAVILKIDVKDIFSDAKDIPASKTSDKSSSDQFEYKDFRIIESEKTQGEIFVSPDIAICEDCKKELFDPSNRRYHHPFINCTSCGPRLTILDSLPYDRERTSMKVFPMCPECEREYKDPSSRRYDAQPVCCPDCGPEVYFIPTAGKDNSKLISRDAITYTRRIIANGGIVAVKGIGGFHLVCDAFSSKAVNLLRTRKARPDKPFAVMMKDMSVVHRECYISDAEKEVLTGHQKPIILLDKRSEGQICPEVAPSNPCIGVMLPYAPIQLLLSDYDDDINMPDCLVMTSGNISGAPIVKDDESALTEIGHLCEGILTNNREIRLRTDDSVMDFFRDEPYMIRRSRGYAPIPYMMSRSLHGQILAIGGELKNTFCLSKDTLFYPSSYIGDLEDPRSVAALEDSIHRMESLLEVKPDVIACDLHPKYHSTDLALKLAGEYGVEVIQFQHHYAHIASCMAENDLTDPVIGISFDGTGYGDDGTIWGGEIMLADLNGYQRLASIHPFLQIGGDASSKEGWRIAAAMVCDLLINKDDSEDEETLKDMLCNKLDLIDENDVKAFLYMYKHQMNALTSTSGGRLFDAVSAILGICKSSSFEGQASTALMYKAQTFMKEHSLSTYHDLVNVPEVTELLREYNHMTINKKPVSRDSGNKTVTLPTNRLFSFLMFKRLEGLNINLLSVFFHLKLSQLICSQVITISNETGLGQVAISGGCYQNKILLNFTMELLEEEHLTVFTHHLVPPNDGGLALGQAYLAANRKNM